MENPSQYGLSSTEVDIEAYVNKHCLESLQRLSSEGIIASDDSGICSAFPACHVMSQHLVDFEAISRIVGLPFNADQSMLLKLLAECDHLH